MQPWCTNFFLAYLDRLNIKAWHRIRSLWNYDLRQLYRLLEIKSHEINFVNRQKYYFNLFSGFDAEDPSSLSYRCFLLTVLMTSVILHVHYDAFLTAVLSSSVLTLPFTDLNGLYANRDKWTFGLVRDTFVESVFEAIFSIRNIRIIILTWHYWLLKCI